MPLKNIKTFEGFVNEGEVHLFDQKNVKAMSLKNYTQFLQESANFNAPEVLEVPLYEGGAYGHISHPFEDIGLTMEDLRQMITSTVEGAFGPENFVQEKTDGQNIMISWKSGKLIAARNKSHLKDAGENALDSAGIANLFALS